MEATAPSATSAAATDFNISFNPTMDYDAMTPSNIHIPPLPSTDASSSDILLSTATTQILTLEDIILYSFYKIYAFFSIIIKKVIFSMESTATAAAATDSNTSCNPTKDNDAMTSLIIHIPPLPSTDTSPSDMLLSTVAKETKPTLEDIPSELFIQYILPFVGRHQYRFVAAVNRNFHTAYVTAFPKKVTRFNVSTIEHAKICFDEKKGPYHPRLCEKAAREGNLTVLKYLRSIQCPWSNWTCAYAAYYGHLDVIQWCHKNGCEWDEYTCANAAKNGHLDVIQWCRQNGCPWDIRTCAYAAKNGHLDVIKWCRQNGCPWDRDTCLEAAKNGHLHVLQWCRENGCPWDKWTSYYAAENGHLDVIKWCRQNGCPWDSSTCSNAAKNGHLDVVKWCHENGCRWDSDTCKNAAQNGHIDILKWCRRNGCSWDARTCEALESKGYFDVLKWSFENGCKCIVCSKYENLD
jgi:hypothetical protein